MTVKMVDSFSSAAGVAKKLKEAGYVASAGYIGKHTVGLGNGVTPADIVKIHDAGLHFLPIWELDPVQVSYFTVKQGISDGKNATKEARWLKLPKGTAIYFTVDFDAQEADFPAIIAYLEQVRKNLHRDYRMGVYGGIRTLEAIVASPVRPDYWWQTLAWSAGQKFARADIYQAEVSQIIDGLGVDIDEVYANPGWYAAPEKKAIVSHPSGHDQEIAKVETQLAEVKTEVEKL